MSANTVSKVIRTAVFALGLFASAVCSAHGGGGGGGGWHGGGGGWHGGGGGWHGGGGGWHGGGGGWHGGGWHGGGGYYGGGWGWGPGVVIGAPYYDDYYAPACQTVRVCNNHGHCWLQESCY